MSLQQQGHKSREEDNEFTKVSVDTLIKSITHTGNRKKMFFPLQYFPSVSRISA